MFSTHPYLAIAGFIVAYGYILVTYRLYFHPLAKYPGSKLAAVTKWHEFYFDVLKNHGGTFMYEIERMHAEYGPIVRINPNEIHIKDIEWIDILYCGPTSGIRDKYPPDVNKMGTPLSSQSTISHDHHRKRRGAYSTFFSKAAVVTSEPMIHKYVELLGRKLKKMMASNDQLELRTFHLAFASDVVCEHLFGKSLNLCADDETARTLRKNIDKTTQLTQLMKQITRVYPIALGLPLQLLRMLDSDFARIISFKRDLLQQAKTAYDTYEPNDAVKCTKRDVGSDRKDFYHAILESSLSLEEKQPGRIAQEAMVVQFAGGESVAHTLSNATYHLLANKTSALMSLKKELTLAMPNANDKLEVTALEKLPYLTAVNKETLRIGALVTARLPLVSPKEPFNYGKWQIPPGTPISMSQRDLLLDPSIFPSPSDFIPERWLQAGSKVERMNLTFITFSRGSRSCVGLNFAWAELYIVIGCLFRRFELELYDTVRERDVDIVRDFTLGEPSPESRGDRVKVVQANV